MMMATATQPKSLKALAALLAYAALICGFQAIQLASAGSKENNLRIRQVAEGVSLVGEKKNYPDYCWFAGLENRILAEYPKLFELVDLHDKKLHGEKNLLVAVDLHKQIFRQIYVDEVERNLKEDAEKKKSALAESRELGGDHQATVEAKVFSPDHRAAYKLFDLWANTPGDFERRQGDYANYLDSYLLQPGIQFWSYCLSEPADCDRVLNQLTFLARKQELGPVELMQISMNMIMLMNYYKADLVLDKLISNGLLKLEDDTSVQDPEDSRSDEDHEQARQTRMIKNVATLIESDDDFNEATFFYVFMHSNQIQGYVDSKLEGYFVDRINKFSAASREKDADSASNR